jgi:hypothetical protein
LSADSFGKTTANQQLHGKNYPFSQVKITMSNTKRYIPRRDGEFIEWAKTILKDCWENWEKWEIALATVKQFQLLVDNAYSAFQNNSNKELQNRATTATKNAAILELRRFLRTFINSIEGNLNIPDEAISSMGIRPRHSTSHQPIPVPLDAPVLTAEFRQHRELTVYAAPLQHGHPTEYFKNEKYAGFILKYKIENESQWQFVISTRLHHTLTFNDNDKGKFVHLQAAWVNPRMQNGPWSNEIKEIIN